MTESTSSEPRLFGPSEKSSTAEKSMAHSAIFGTSALFLKIGMPGPVVIRRMFSITITFGAQSTIARTLICGSIV